MKLEIFKMHPEVSTPKYGTTLSTCFDIEYFPTEKVIKGYNQFNQEVYVRVQPDGGFYIYPGERLLVPTGLIFKLECPTRSFSLRFHPRSGLALKRGLVLANSEGVVDIDYQEQAYAIILNSSKITQKIEYRERICQAEVVSNEPVEFVVVEEKPERHSERSGGFGSTGTL
jgi:dUTP pyrophosphatase